MNPLHRLSQLATRQIHGLGIGTTIALTMLALLFGVRPLMQQHAATQVVRADLASVRAKVMSLTDEEARIITQIDRIHADLQSSSLRLQTAAYRNERLARLTELAARHRLAVDGLQTAEVEREEHYDMVPLHLAGSGSFPDCAAFLHNLNADFRDMGVNTFEMTGTPGPTQTDVSFVFEMIWYAAPSLVLASETE
jgi:hypothetical protein